MKETSNALAEYAVNPLIEDVTEIGSYVEPLGTVTFSDVAVADVTVAFAPPK